jgi:NADH-quinone oxidoreductase subunit K
MDLLTLLIVVISMLFIGLCGIFLNRRSLLVVLMSVELVLLSLNFNLLITSVYLSDRLGQVFAIFVLTVAAAESSIGLAILIVYYRVKGTVAINYVNFLKG